MVGDSKPKVFITGITGFTGIHLENYLTQLDFQVFGTTLNDPTNRNHYLVDLNDSEKLSLILKELQPDYVIHLAAISFVANENIREIYDINLLGTINLLEAISTSCDSISKIILASSAAVYGNVSGELDESLCPQPVNHYGISKLAMENSARMYFSELPCIITRPFNYTGVGQAPHFLVPKLISHFRDKKSAIELGNIHVYREFNDISFICKIYHKLLLSSVDSEIVNVCSGREQSLSEILNLLEEITNHKIEVKVNPEFVRENEIKSLKGSKDKLEKILNEDVFQSLPSMNETLTSMLS